MALLFPHGFYLRRGELFNSSRSLSAVGSGDGSFTMSHRPAPPPCCHGDNFRWMLKLTFIGCWFWKVDLGGLCHPNDNGFRGVLSPSGRTNMQEILLELLKPSGLVC